MMSTTVSIILLWAWSISTCQGLLPRQHRQQQQQQHKPKEVLSRRDALTWFGQTTLAITTIGISGNNQQSAVAAEMNVENFLKNGGVSMPMGVSGQGGKMRPTTGIVLKDGSEVFRDSRNGQVSAEILLKGKDGKVPVLASFASPWPLATGSNYDVECRDGKTGDGAYLAVSTDVQGKSIADLSNKFFQDQLFSSTGRFSFYGAPTDVKVTKSVLKDNYRILDINFSILSQSTGSEVPRKAQVVATIPDGTNQAIMLVGNSSTLRWKKGTDQKIASTIDSFRAVPAPQTSMRIRAKDT